VAWLFVHVFYLVGFRNRFLVIGEWAWMYLRYERGARLITDDVGGFSAKPGRIGSGSSSRPAERSPR
jgi:NADH dehydrogenase